jgi:hypothetical protein
MEKLRKTFVLLLVAGIPAGAPIFLARSPELCFADGSTTWRLSPTARPADYRVAIDNGAQRPDLRVGLVDRVETADFALVDDAGALIGGACQIAGRLRSVRIVAPGEPADLTIAVVRGSDGADLTLYVHSARVTHFEAAALFALIRHSHGRATAREFGG